MMGLRSSGLVGKDLFHLLQDALAPELCEADFVNRRINHCAKKIAVLNTLEPAETTEQSLPSPARFMKGILPEEYDSVCRRKSKKSAYARMDRCAKESPFVSPPGIDGPGASVEPGETEQERLPQAETLEPATSPAHRTILFRAFRQDDSRQRRVNRGAMSGRRGAKRSETCRQAAACNGQHVKQDAQRPRSCGRNCPPKEWRLSQSRGLGRGPSLYPIETCVTTLQAGFNFSST
jgi:hypothetical protein